MNPMGTMEGPTSANWYVVVAGLPPPTEPLTLGGGITLVPLEDRLSIFDLAAAGAVGFQQWAVLEGVAAACTCELESALDAAISPGYDTLNRAWLASALLVLRGFSAHIAPACCSYSWGVVAGHRTRSAPSFQDQLQEEGVGAAVYRPKYDLPPFKGGILDFHLSILVHNARRTDAVNAGDATWIRQHFDTFDQLAVNSQQFRFALESAYDWRFAKDPRIAVARLWSGIEALFGISSELVFRISLVCAALLEPRGLSRKALFDDVKRLYNLRSKAVHGEGISEKDIASAMNESFDLLRRLLLRSIELGHATSQEDIDKALFL